MFPSLHGVKTHHASIYSNADRVGYHLSEIAHRLLLETNTVTPLLQRMEKQGIIIRKRGKEDKRQQIVSLTEKGKALEEMAFSSIPAGMAKKLSVCPLRLEDYLQLAKELDTIIESLNNRKE